MDKAKFVEVAPAYYALAIVVVLLKSYGPTTRSDVVGKHAVYDEDDPENPHLRVVDGPLLAKAIALLEQEKLIRLEEDYFGPELIHATDNFQSDLDNEFSIGEIYSLYDKYKRAGVGKDQWLSAALDKLAQTALRLGIQPEDFENLEAEWRPIQIDSEQAETKAVIEALDDATEKLRADNGYAANKPQEQAYVLAGLSTFAEQFKKKSEISLPFIRQYAIEPLTKAAKTLGRSVAGIVVDVLKQKLKIWLMKQGIPWPWDFG